MASKGLLRRQVLAANPEDKALSSDADPQMLVKVVFKELKETPSVTTVTCRAALGLAAVSGLRRALDVGRV